jgi:hypothetical protein
MALAGAAALDSNTMGAENYNQYAEHFIDRCPRNERQYRRFFVAGGSSDNDFSARAPIRIAWMGSRISMTRKLLCEAEPEIRNDRY